MTRTLVLWAAVLCAEPAVAQTPDTPSNLKSAELDVSVPSSPAFAVLGLTPDTVITPSISRALAASLLNGVDPNGTIQSGIAIDAAPYFLAYGSKITLQTYQTNRIVRFLSRLQVSIATAKAAATNDQAVRVSGGVRLTFWDTGDYRSNDKFRTDLSDARNQAMDDLKKEGEEPSLDEKKQLAFTKKLDDRVAVLAKAIRERYRQETWNNSGFVVGAAPTWVSQTGATSALAQSGGAVWASLAYGFEHVPGLENTSQIIVHGRYRSGDRVPKPDTANDFYTQSSALGGVRIRFGAVDTNASFESVYLHTNPDGLPTENYFRLSAAAEHRVVDNVWLHFSVGGESGRKDDRSHLFVLTNLKFSVGDKKQ